MQGSLIKEFDVCIRSNPNMTIHEFFNKCRIHKEHRNDLTVALIVRQWKRQYQQ